MNDAPMSSQHSASEHAGFSQNAGDSSLSCFPSLQRSAEHRSSACMIVWMVLNGSANLEGKGCKQIHAFKTRTTSVHTADYSSTEISKKMFRVKQGRSIFNRDNTDASRKRERALDYIFYCSHSLRNFPEQLKPIDVIM